MKDPFKTKTQLNREPAALRDCVECPEGAISGIAQANSGGAIDNDDRSFFDAANVAIAIHDIRTFQFIDINRKFTEMFGYELEEMQEGGLELLAPKETPYTQEDVFQWLRQAANGLAQLFEAKARKKTGESIWMEVSLKRGRLRGQDCLLALIRDVTDRKRAEEDLRESERKFRTLFESSHEALLMIDEDGIFDCNQKALETVRFFFQGRSARP